MGKTENLRSIDTIDIVREFVSKATICFFTTNLFSTPLFTRPMSTQQVDENGIIWLFSKVDSDINTHIKNDDRVQLFYFHSASSKYLSIFGRAEIVIDKRKNI